MSGGSELKKISITAEPAVNTISRGEAVEG
jgi:hypothetical protein